MMRKPEYVPVNYTSGNQTEPMMADNKIETDKYHFVKTPDGFALFNKSTLSVTYIDQSIYQHLIKNENPRIDPGLISLLQNDIDCESPVTETPSHRINKIFLHVSHDCNLSCPYCYAAGGDYGKDKKMMSLETAVKAIGFIIERDPAIKELTVEFFGGEPLLNHGMTERLIEHIEKHFTGIAFKYGCVTNATVMNHEIHNMLKKYDFNVMMTIDGPQPYHDLQRIYADGKGSFEDVLKNIKSFKDAVSDLSARIVYTKLNVDLYTIYKYIYEELGITNISFRPVMTEDKKFKLDADDIRKSNEEIRKCFMYYLEKKLRRQKITTSLFDGTMKSILHREKKRNFCDFGSFVSITPEGYIYPCTHFVYNEAYKFGSIDDKNLDETVISYCLKSGLINYSPCGDCWMKNLCGGGCKGSAEFYYKNIYTKDEFCDTRETIITQAIVEITRARLNDGVEKLYEIFKAPDKNLIPADRWR